MSTYMIHEVGRAGVGVHSICRVKKLEAPACTLGRVNCGMHDEMPKAVGEHVGGADRGRKASS